MYTLLLVLLVVVIVVATHFLVSYLLKNDMVIVGVSIGFVGIMLAIVVFAMAMGSFTDYVAGELEFFYR